MSDKRKNRALGEWGEKMALNYFESAGYELMERNYRAGRHEIDLIMRDGDTVVFIEVKARSVLTFGRGREAVDRRKQAHIADAAAQYAVAHGLMDASLRFDVAEVDLNTGKVECIKGAFIT